MLRLPSSVRIFLAAQPTDMRKGFDGLAALVKAWGEDIFEGHLYVFVSRRGDRVKVLNWDRGGFVLWYKRLEKDRFPWPRRDKDGVVQMTGRELNWLLDGYDVMRMTPHERLHYHSVL